VPRWYAMSTFIQTSENESYMTTQADLAELERRHHELEKEIADALAHSSTDDLTIADLKRQKLHVKDEIERLRQRGIEGINS
jgi:hypothetical protein